MRKKKAQNWKVELNSATMVIKDQKTSNVMSHGATVVEERKPQMKKTLGSKSNPTKKRKKTVEKKSEKKWLTPRATYEDNKALFVEPEMGKELRIPQEWGFKDFVLKEAVGHGAFGVVFRAREVMTGVTLALKVVQLKDTRIPGDTIALTEEIKTHSELRHANICRLYGYFLTANYLVFVMEYCGGGTLLTEMNSQRNKCFDNKQAAIYIEQIARAVLVCHRNRIMHRDLKPENILLDRNKQVKLTDFGWACTMKNGERRFTHGGTTEFNAPEVVDSESGYHYEAEVWSIGCVLYEMLYGRSPFMVVQNSSNYKKSQSEQKTLIDEAMIKSILRDKPKYRSRPGITVDMKLQDLIKKCLQKDATKRIKLKDLLRHPGLVQYVKRKEQAKS